MFWLALIWPVLELDTLVTHQESLSLGNCAIAFLIIGDKFGGPSNFHALLYVLVFACISQQYSNINHTDTWGI